MDVDIQVHGIDAALFRAMCPARMPGTIAQPRLADLRQIEAAPFAAPRQRCARLASELEGQHPLRSVLMPDDMWTERAPAAVIDARHLLFLDDRLAEQPVGCRCHALEMARGREAFKADHKGGRDGRG